MDVFRERLLDSLSDEEIIAELTKRGYVVRENQ
jgi:hypothetical protein